MDNYRATLDERKQFVEGARVRHFLFGDGVIKSTAQNTNAFGHEGLVAEIIFDDGKTKSIEVTILPLAKLTTI